MGWIQVTLNCTLVKQGIRILTFIGGDPGGGGGGEASPLEFVWDRIFSNLPSTLRYLCISPPPPVTP